MVNNGHLLCFRWLEPRVEPRKVSGQTMPAVPNNRHHQPQISPRLWLGRPSFLICWYRHTRTNIASNHEEVVMIFRWQTTKISLVLSPRYSAKLKSPLMPVAEPPELFWLKCISHRYTADTNSTHFKRNNSLVCRVSARCNHGSTGSKQVYLARRRVYSRTTAHQL
jgi:hypothetical protein